MIRKEGRLEKLAIWSVILMTLSVVSVAVAVMFYVRFLVEDGVREEAPLVVRYERVEND